MSQIRRPFLLCLFLLALASHVFAAPYPPETVSRVLTATLADPAFNSTYLRNGCFVRAHWIANELQLADRTPVKVFVRPGDPAHRIQFTDRHLRTYRWVFHVAAAYRERISETEERVWILDPLFSPTPLTLQEWLTRFRAQNPDLELKVSIVNPDIYADLEEDNREFRALGDPFGIDAMDFIRDAMEQLTYWESLES